MIKIYSKPIIDNAGAAAIYFIARALDLHGQGWVKLDLKSLSIKLTVTKRTIWRRIQKAHSLGYFIEIERKNHIVFVKYISTNKIKKLSNGLIAQTYISMDQFADLNKLRSIAYEAAIIAQQLRTQYAIENSSQIKQNTIVNPSKDAQSWRCNRRCAGINTKTNSVFLTKNSHIATSNQTTVANQLGRTRQTVLTHSKKLKHFRINIEQIKKYLPINWQTDGRFWVNTTQENIRTHLITLLNGSEKIVKISKRKVKIYRRLPNVYISDKIIMPKTSYDNSKETFNNKQIRDWEKFKTLQRKLSLNDVLANLCDLDLHLLAHSFLLYYRGQTSPILNTWNKEQIISGINQTIKSCLSASLPFIDDHLGLNNPEDQVKELVLRIQDPANICPLPWVIYTNIAKSFNDQTLLAIRGTKLDPTIAENFAYNSTYNLLPPNTTKFSPAKKSQPPGETWIEYVGRVMNKPNLIKLVQSAILIYELVPYKLTNTESYSDLIVLLEQLSDNNYQGKTKSQVIREMVHRRLKSKTCIPHYYLLKLEKQKQFILH